jgi:hypothetical protein
VSNLIRFNNLFVKGAGGLIRAYNAYLNNNAFLSVFAFEVTDQKPSPAEVPSAFWRTTFETVFLPPALLALMVIGIGGILAPSYILSLPVSLAGDLVARLAHADFEFHRVAAGWIRQVTAWLVSISAVAIMPLSLFSANEIHKERWLFPDDVPINPLADDHGVPPQVDSFEGRTAMSPSNAQPQAPPRRLHFIVSIALLIAIAWIGLRFHPRPQAWLMILGLMAAFALVNGHGIAGVRWGILIDNRDRMSLSRLQMLAWMLLILSAVLTAILGNVSSGSASPMDIQIPSQLWILLGISTTTAVSAPALLNNKRPKQPDDKEMEKTTAELMTQGHAGPDPDEASVVLRNASIQDARWSDLLKGDESGNASSVDLGKLQMFYFTFILVCGYGAALYAMFKGPATVTALPPVQDGMNVMPGISQVGYLASKAVTVSKEKVEAPQQTMRKGAGQ